MRLYTSWDGRSSSIDFARALILPGWAHNATILLVMQHATAACVSGWDEICTLFRRVWSPNPNRAEINPCEQSHALAWSPAARMASVGLRQENLIDLHHGSHPGRASRG
jgi:hypothetical protein